jgi:hypothetical protein
MRMLDRSGSRGKPEAGPAPARTLRRLGLSRAILPQRTRPILAALAVSFVLAGSGALTAVPVALAVGEPAPPTNVIATRGNLQATISWTASPNQIDGDFLGYTVWDDALNPVCFTDLPTDNVCVVEPLFNGVLYSFTVTAVNSAGDSTPAGPVTVTPSDVAPTTPGAPTGVSSDRGDRQATVHWGPPVDDGGSTLTGYTVSDGAGHQCGGLFAADRQCTITGLTNGTLYTFTVKAMNAEGDGAGADTSVTPATLPGAPTNVQGVRGDRQATITWEAPVDTGGLAVTYTVYNGATPATCGVGSGTYLCVVTGLNNGTTYHFTVTATNDVDEGPASSPAVDVTPATTPGSPTNVTPTREDSAALISWTVPADNGGSAILRYEVINPFDTVVCTANGAATTSCNVTGLTNGTEYTFRVRAVNGVGNSTPAGPVAVTPASLPGAPTNVQGQHGNMTATITWSAPADTGGLAVTYTVYNGASLATCGEGSSTYVCVATGLNNGTTYHFTVTATNDVGEGPHSSPTTDVTPSTIPGIPGTPLASKQDASVDLAWTAPADNGGSAITGYVVTETVPSPGVVACTFSDATHCTVSGLTNGTSYQFTVSATNINGNGSPSAASIAVTPSTVPAKPAAPQVARTNGAVVLTITPPNDGGSGITGYTVSETLHGLGIVPCTLVLNSCTVSGLTNGTSYAFTVLATNANGNSLPSDVSATVVPAAVPSKVTGVTADRGNGQATIHWAIPANNGNPLTGFLVSDGAGHTCSGASTATTCTVTGLTNGTQYSFTVLASNTVGPGPASDPVVVTPATVPGKPTGIAVVRGNQSVNVSWVAPANGGAPITGYTVSDGAGHTCTGGAAATNCTVTGLTNGTVYTFTVRATNNVGTGPASDPSEPISPISGATYHALAPARILDTRSGNGLSGVLSSHVGRTFNVWGQGGVPVGATAVTGNLTVTQQTRQGFLFIGPVRQDNPTSSTLNFPTGDDRANAVTVALSSTGTLSVTYAAPTLGPTAHAIFDVTGYFTPDLSGATYTPLSPKRILDTRDGTGGISVLSSHVAQGFQVRGQGGVPPNATAVTGNLTVTQQQAMGFLFIGPNRADNPTSSTLNFPVGDDRANAVTVQIGTDGKLWVTYAAPYLGPTAQAIFDVTGYFTNDSTGALWFPLNPTRILDTRTGIGGLGIASSHVAQTFMVRGHGQVPSDATAVTGNLTVTQQQLNGFLFIGPDPMNNPTSSTLNFPYGDDRANSATVRLSTGGQLSVTYAAPVYGPTAHVIFDVTGYFVR